MKVFGIGWHKTGTKTLGKCLSEFGFDVRSWNISDFNAWRDEGFKALIPIIERYSAFEDWPWSFCYKELSRNYPDAKFILTRRDTEDRWYKSYYAHTHRAPDRSRHKLIYGHDIPDGYRDRHISIYRTHNKNVRNFFSEGFFFKKPKENFLEVCWEEGDGWEKLARFLNRMAPAIPFPHENKRPDGITMDNLKK